MHRTSCWSGLPRGFSLLNLHPSSHLSILFRLNTLHQSVEQNLTNRWHSSFEIDAAQLRSVAESRRNHRPYVWTGALSDMVFVVMCEQKPHPIWFSLLCVNRCSIRYGFHAVPKAVRCGGNIALLLNLTCGTIWKNISCNLLSVLLFQRDKNRKELLNFLNQTL